MRIVLLLILLLPTFAAAEPKAKGKVIDIGNLEVDGELRRPNVNWIDSQKRIKDLLPAFHREEFRALERELLKPGDTRGLEAAASKKGECHAIR